MQTSLLVGSGNYRSSSRLFTIKFTTAIIPVTWGKTE